jgi:hypothetical protein
VGEQPSSKHWATTTAARRRRRAAALGVLAAAGVLALLGRAVWPAGRPPAAPGPVAVVSNSDSGGITGGQPPRVLDGVPVGWPPGRAGAVAAAAGYARVLSALWFLTDPGRRARALGRMAAPEAAAGLRASQDALAGTLGRGPFGAGLARPGVASLLRTSLLGYRVDHYDPDTATVAVWALVVYGNDGGLAPQALWATSTLRLRWAGDWKLVEVGTVPGPTPVAGQAPPSPPAELLRAAAEFEEFDGAPGA